MDATHLAGAWKQADDPSRPIAFLVSTTDGYRDLPGHLGHADYSYGFVLQALAPALERLGRWELVRRPESSLVAVAAQRAAEGFRPIHLALAPLHNVYLTPAVPNVVMPFWEFPRVPDRDFGWDTRQNWARIGRCASLVLSACRLTADSFRDAGLPCPVEVVPVPLDSADFDVPDWSPDRSWTLNCRHVTWGGPAPEPGPTPVQTGPAAPPPRPRLKARARHALKVGYRRHVRPWLSEMALDRITQTKRKLVRRLHLPAQRLPQTPLTLSGLVYTSVFNIGDLRKNPQDMLSAFLLAFRDRPDVTLVLKLASNAITEQHEIRTLNAMLLSLGIEHRCRVVAILDYLTEDQMRDLLGVSTFYLNTSRAEGACLPLQRALAAGRPAIAPAHTAMADYLDDTVGYPVASHPEPTHWPHDPERRSETTWHRLVWSDLRDQLLRGADEAQSDPAAYRARAAAARRRMREHADIEVVVGALRDALSGLQAPPAGSTGWAA